MALPLSLLISDLQAALGSEKVVLPGSDSYKAGLKRWAESIEKPAGVIVYPTSSQDVSLAIQLAGKHSVPLTAVCGGHGTSGDSSICDGLLINMRRLNTVTVDPEALTLTCAGGCVWAEIDAASAKYNMSSVGGTVNQTGVAGFTTGGGFGWLSGKHGLAIDNLLSAEVVLADGRIVRCSDTEEPDLFWAVRGAGHMFGIVTEFVFRGFSQPNPVYGGLVMFPPTPAAIEHLINFANSIAATSDGRSAMMCGFTTPAHMPGKRVIFGTCFYDGPEAEGVELYAPLLNGPVKPLKSTLTSMSYPEMNNVLAMAAQAPGRRVSKGASYEPPLPPSAFQQVLDMYEKFVADVCPEAGEAGPGLFEFYSLAKVASVDATATAYVGRGYHANAIIIPRWKTEQYDGVCRQFARDAMDVISKCVREKGGAVSDYLNYDGLGTPAARTFGVNYERLKTLKARYDPTNVFDKRLGLATEPKAPAPPVAAEPTPESTTQSLPQTEAPITPQTESPATSQTGSPITHQIVIHEIGSDPVSLQKTAQLLSEIKSATSKLAGVNVTVTSLPASDKA